MRYAIYSIETGQITRVSQCREEDLSSQINDGQASIELSTGNDLTHYVQDQQAVQIPAAPSPAHVFDYATKQWVDPRTAATEWAVVRPERNRRLVASDWTQLPDVPIQTKDAWAVYRQALRDVTGQPDPFSIVWPVAPG